ncbi:uncharacterized protein LOC122131235 isoform X2 [Clupea harengus]|uniref:Uncharacterized protein LOC122131235 isoform X2 n=2 Tax=Clupea harengus TaxID=7950 RepID=A0A8M1KIB1_CLUHA|nr:uncharacterized protein LOC122131235 isoform X2 [Clupea harengus]
MQAVLLLLLLAGASKGLDSTCNATQDAACYGALGGPVYLQLMRNTSGHALLFNNEPNLIFGLIGSKTVFFDEFNTPTFLQRWQFVPDNGTLIINPAERRDGGTYRVEIYKSTVGYHTVQLIVKAPVSVLNLSISCSAYGEKRVSCSSNGDSPQYSWSVDGRPLKPPEASPKGSTERLESSPDLDTDLSSSTLTLPEGIQGHLTCSARNNISRANETQLLPSCTTNAAPTASTLPHHLTSTVSVTTSSVVSMATNTTLGPAFDTVISLDSTCDATQDAACYGALGGPVYLQLMRNTSGHTLSFHNERKAIFTLRPSKTVFYKDYNTPSFLQRWQFVPDNGTLIINPAERKDAGTYRVRIFNKSTGKSVGEHTVQLIIEAPVSDVDLSISCSANEEWRVRCSSNGDSPQYSWYLDGRPLSEADADLSADIQTLLLNGNVTGELTCSVSNHVNSTNTSVLLLDVCSGISSVFISVWLAEIIILTSLLVGGYYIYIRNKRTHTPDERKDQEVELTPTSSY